MTLANPEHIIVGLSGGVDSAVAALLLREQGLRVQGLFMKNWDEDDSDGQCSAATDLRDAQSVSAQLDIPLHAVNFSSEYWERVFSHFLDEYRAGRTPNPDVLCNKEIKFRAFLDHAIGLGADRIATGHYARTRHDKGAWRLYKGIDADKDQSYFLHLLDQTQLSRAVFPLGELRKQIVRELAARAGFVNHAKKDSTGVCFIGERNFRQFLSRFLPAQPGPICTLDGRVIGQHQGLMYHTLGQRQGLGIGGLRDSTDAPWYVINKDCARNTLTVAQGADHPQLNSTGLIATQVHWIADAAPAALCCHAKIRYRQADQACALAQLDDGRYRVLFDRPQRAVAPGQSVVFYRADECLGGGVIESRLQDADASTAASAASNYT
ncbi:MAG: tRNA 2-thiouridine(34) synthase MnmA [Gammaproteobacteria bacterium]